MSIMISPGVYTTEYDFSYYGQILSNTTLGIVTTASKGPVNERTYISNEASLVDTFGNPSINDLGLLAAIRFLRKGRQLWVVRVAGYSEATASGAIKNTGLSDCVTLTPLSSGSWGNSIQVIIADSTFGGGKRLIIKVGTYQAERYENLNLTPGDPNNIETRLNGISVYLSASIITSALLMQNGTYTLSGGDDGSSVTDADVIGTYNPVTMQRTGLELFRNSEAVDVSILAAPGFSSANVVAELLDICETRGDCMALIDPPYGLTVQQVVDWHNGLLVGPSYPTTALNSTYGALQWSWLEVFDGYSGTDIWLPPSGHTAGMYAFTDYNFDPWFAPAGFIRGTSVDILDLEHSPDLGERDYLYGGTNAVNPFAKFVPDGIALWGQKTLGRANTARNRVNVRRMLLYSRKLVATSVRYLTFEPNDAFTRLQFNNIVEPICRDIKARRGLYDYRIICDQSNNPPATIDRNELHGKVMMQPTKTSEMIEVGFNLIPTGASFDEY